MFETPQTITLTPGQLELSDTTGTETIAGPTTGVTVDADGNSRVFQVDGGVTASISGMTITGGNAGYNSYGGGLANYGTASLTNCTVSGNTANGFSGFSFNSGGGVENYGGATLTMTGCTVSGNSAAAAYFGGSGYGGGVDNGGTATLANCTISKNSSGGTGAGVLQRW